MGFMSHSLTLSSAALVKGPSIRRHKQCASLEARPEHFQSPALYCSLLRQPPKCSAGASQTKKPGQQVPNLACAQPDRLGCPLQGTELEASVQFAGIACDVAARECMLTFGLKGAGALPISCKATDCDFQPGEHCNQAAINMLE